MVESNNIVSLAINHEVNDEHNLFRLKRDSVLRIHPGSSLLGRNVALFCNYPGSSRFNFLFFFLVQQEFEYFY